MERELRTNALDMSPLIVVTGTAYRCRIRPGINTKLRASDTDSEIWDKIHEIWAQCRSKGCGVRARNSLANNVPWPLRLAYKYTAACLAKVLTFMSVNDNRWADLVMNARVLNSVLTQLLNTVERELRANALDMSPLIVVTGTAYHPRQQSGEPYIGCPL